MIFRKFKFLITGVFSILLILFEVVSSVAAPARVGMVTNSASSERISIILSFPEIEWNGTFELTLEYDPAVLKYSSSGCNIPDLPLSAEVSSGSVTLKNEVGIEGEGAPNEAVRINLVFRVLDHTPKSATIKCTPKDIYDKNQVLAVSGTSSLMVTLIEPSSTTSPSSNTTTTDSNSGSVTDDNPKPSDSSVPSDTTSDVKPSTDTVSSVTQTDSDVVSDTVSDVVSITETQTDTSDTVQSDASTDLSSDVSSDSQWSDRGIPLPPSTDRTAIFLLAGAAVLLVVLAVVELVRRGRWN